MSTEAPTAQRTTVSHPAIPAKPARRVRLWRQSQPGTPAASTSTRSASTVAKPAKRRSWKPEAATTRDIHDSRLHHHELDRQLAMKYACDRVLGCIALVLAAPAIAILWCLVKMTSRGPGFYWQVRVGLNEKTFSIVKLRTMRCDAEAGGKVRWCELRDSRITPLGRILRRLHLDELPQLWNVACGDMCFVGPRPERPEIARSLEKLIPAYHLRHRVKPGITGLAQINLEPDRDINMTRKKQVLDLRYVHVCNLWLDARMVGATVLRMFGIKGDRVIELTGLKQSISDYELLCVGYEFDVQPELLWNPSKGPL